MSEVLASAVIVPSATELEAPDTSIEQNGLKRRQSETSETENKRQRTGKSPPPASEENADTKTSDSTVQIDSPSTNPSTNVNGDDTQKPDASREERRKSSVAGDKQRSKRLFGALLGNLNQPRDRTSKRRAEIEQRRKAELEKQDNERLEDKQRRLARLAVHRKKEQVNVDEHNMHTRHKNLLNSANMLRTKVESRLYYRPWDLLSDDEDTIAQQVSDAREQIDKEVADFAREKEERLAAIRDPRDAPTQADAAPGADIEAMDTDTNKDSQPHSTNQESSTSAAGGEAGKANDADEAMQDSTSKEADAEARDESEKPAETTTGTIEDAQKTAAEIEAKRVEAEDEGDLVVEGDGEDTVIY
ncbi:unnamed protein product [Zymoseptoria tritici ST99CH_3D1]|nr:unnamed protein product [Zymoseptoria tritici ST99CH_3D1]